ncbi:MAG TPA: histone deacetylase family protein [Rhizomicrobium sp.]|nr:histone deacetylase family protein [Rhizomicrobium sp.]
MPTGLFTHPACLGHAPPAGHPERPERLEHVLKSLKNEEFQMLVWAEAPLAPLAALSAAHAPALVEAILGPLATKAERDGFAQIDPDTIMSAGSAAAARRAAGAAIAVVDAIMAGTITNAFCAVRPPGHHAEHARAMGFCLFNNVAVAAKHAQNTHGIRRIAIVDFDVHHGNGTQDIFDDDANVFYASTHQAPFYPGTGAAIETGCGNILNVPLAGGCTSQTFRAAYADSVLPALVAFAPEMVFISAGFDGHAADPLAGFRLTAEDFVWVTDEICRVAARFAKGRVVSVLEGGYDLDALAACVAAHVAALMNAAQMVQE